jgi:hypothetical protein
MVLTMLACHSQKIIKKDNKMKKLTEEQIQEVSGGESLIDAIHRYEWNSYGVLLTNAAIYAYNMFAETPVDYVEKIPAPE